jgi:hypothetical protein
MAFALLRTARVNRGGGAHRAPPLGLAHRLLVRLRMRHLLRFLLVVTASCQNGGTDCLGDSPELFVDPQTGTCIEVGDSDACQRCGIGPCTVGDARVLDLAPCSGGLCGSATEMKCLDQPGCIAEYIDGGFHHCGETALSGPVHSGQCVDLDAHECSRHDNCSAWYVHTANGTQQFDHCADEPAAPVR